MERSELQISCLRGVNWSARPLLSDLRVPADNEHCRIGLVPRHIYGVGL